MVEIFSNINLTNSALANLLIQALLLEIAVFVAVPLVGIIIDGVFVRLVRSIIARLFTQKGEFVFSNYVLCVGVVIHELSHAFFALITGAKIVEIALFKPENGTLGHVLFQPRGNTFTRALQSSFSSCAPVVIGMVIATLFLAKIFPVLSATWMSIVAIYFFVSVVFHMNMSKQDLKVYFTGTLPLLAVFLPISLAVIHFA